MGSCSALLKRIQAGDFILTPYTLRRMNERYLNEADIVECARTHFRCEYQKFNGRWVIEGFSVDREEMGFVSEEEDDIIIVTLYRRGE